MSGATLAKTVLYIGGENSFSFARRLINIFSRLRAGFFPPPVELGFVKNFLILFKNLALSLSLFAVLTGQPLCAAFAQEAPPTIDPETGIVHSRRLVGGLPLGGVGTGTFQIMTDGTLSAAAITNNLQQPTGDLNGCFAALWTRTGGRTQARVLALTSPYGLPIAAALDFDGRPPLALLTYPDDNLPVNVSLRAFSPLTPFDIRNASHPAAAFVFQFRNRSADTVEISIALSWENVLGVGGTAGQGPFANRTGDAIALLPSADGVFGLRFTGPPLTPGTSPAERLRDNATGEMALLAAPSRKDATVTLAGWNALDPKPNWWEAFAQSGDVAGNAPPGVEGKAHPAGVVAVRLTLRPNEFAEIPFAVSWRTPRYYTNSGVEYRKYDSARWPDAPASARDLLENWRSLLALTLEWQEALQFSNLPRPLVRDLINSVTPLQTNTIHTADAKFTFFAGGNSGPLSPNLQQAKAADNLLSAFFPALLDERAEAIIDTEYALEKPNPLPAKPNTASSVPDAYAAYADIAAQIAAGRPEAGIAALEKWDAARNASGISPWAALESPPVNGAKSQIASPPLRANAVPSLAQAGAWQILDALTGFVYDAKTSQMTLNPQIPGTWRSLVAPIFRPTFQGRIEFRPTAHGGLLSFRLDRLAVMASAGKKRKTQTNAQLLITALRVPAPPRADLSPTTVHVSVRQEPLGFHLTLEPATSTLLITLDTPRPLFAGDRIEIDVH